MRDPAHPTPKKSNRLLVLAIKYIPVLSTFLLTLHIGLLMAGIYEPISVGICAVLTVLLLILLSFRFNFCRLHKARIMYMGAATLCICFNKLHLFGATLDIARLVMFLFGITLMMQVLIKNNNNGAC